MSCTYTNRVYLPADVRVQAQAGYDSMAANVVRTLDQVRQVFPGMNSPSNRPILDAIEWLIQDEELVSYHTRINEVLLQIQSMPQAGQPESSSPNQRFGLL
ncbi:MAG: hypothetical protein C5B49_06065 [Bdellovibrio sp.]|nr:MAG: hypothetical protein C5B49_06065 [Bdellovibrio sp.]